MSNTNQNIYSKPCVYNCGIQIYWNTLYKAYFEVFTKKRHLCPNRVNKLPSVPNNTSAAVGATTTSNTKPIYYSKKPWNTKPKPKMSNSFELLTGQNDVIQKKYEILSDLVSEYGGKVFGSQSHIRPHNNALTIIVYFEVTSGRLEEFKKRFQTNVSTILREH